jgi:hypothetical protein
MSSHLTTCLSCYVSTSSASLCSSNRSSGADDITLLLPLCTAGTAGLVAVGRKGRRVNVLDAATGAVQASITAAAPDKQSGGAAAGKVQLAAVAFVQQQGGDRCVGVLEVMQLLPGSL